MRRLLFTVLLLALAGCGGGSGSKEAQRGGMTAAEWLTVDWRGIGYEDGVTGRRTGAGGRDARMLGADPLELLARPGAAGEIPRRRGDGVARSTGRIPASHQFHHWPGDPLVAR